MKVSITNILQFNVRLAEGGAAGVALIPSAGMPASGRRHVLPMVMAKAKKRQSPPLSAGDKTDAARVGNR
ncbi:hypothetical protein KCP75_10785 [Salmonella enterica subsp. enterica]|nr:hypothetical protein KCP75_10785 [Salmonella enterica subsp. enterica]